MKSFEETANGMNDSSRPSLEIQAATVKSIVREQLEEDEVYATKPYVLEPKTNIFNCEHFKLRIIQAVRRVYLGMLENGGMLPGKTDCFNAAEPYTVSMTEIQKAIYYMCVYEACCESSIHFKMAGKMNGKLREADNSPHTIPGADQG